MKSSTFSLLIFVAAPVLFAQNREALIIGNGAYAGNPLRNPTNDARDMGVALEDLGFNVTTLIDADKRRTIEAIREFGSRLDRSTTGLFYYAGHGAQANGQNYMIPVDADIQSQGELNYFGVPVGLAMSKMQEARNRRNIVILDACRDNPFPGYGRSGERGLVAAGTQPPESMIIYATAPGRVAGDNPIGRNGFFTGALLQYIRKPGLELDDMMKLVTNATVQRNPSQVPWRNSSMISDFYFAGSAGNLKVDAPLQDKLPEIPVEASSSLEGAVLSTYSGRHGVLGQAIMDTVTANSALITISALPGGTYQWNLGNSKGTKTAENGRIQLFLDDLDDFRSELNAQRVTTLTLGRGFETSEFTIVYRPSEIHSWQDLQAMRRDLSGIYKQMTDIAFPDTDGDGVGDYNFDPIGRGPVFSASMISARTFSNSSTRIFRGIFDGRNYTISRLYIARRSEDYIGLFGSVAPSAEVKNVVLEDVHVAGREKVGALAGWALRRSIAGQIGEDSEVTRAKGKPGVRLVGEDFYRHEVNGGLNLSYILGATFSSFDYGTSEDSTVTKNVPAFGFNTGYAYNFSTNWALDFAFLWGFPLESSSFTPSLSAGAVVIRMGLRFITASKSPVNLVVRTGIGTGFPAYFNIYAGLGMRITVGSRWFIDLLGDYQWPGYTPQDLNSHMVTPRINTGYQW